MQNTTLCYIECNEHCLLMHRTKKTHDTNANKWIGIGGHMEEGESPEECAAREIMEETALIIPHSALHYRGIVTFQSDSCEGEYMHLFSAPLPPYCRRKTGGDAHEETALLPPLPECAEGELAWIAADKMNALPQWEGDKIFLSLMHEKDRPFFSLKLSYKGGNLTSAALNGMPYPLPPRN